MSLHPDIVKILLRIVTPDQFDEIYRVQWEIDQREKPHARKDHDRLPDASPAISADAAPPAGPAVAPADAPATSPAIAPATGCNITPLSIDPSPAWKRRREALRAQGLPANWRGRLDSLTPAIAPVAPAIAPVAPAIAPVARAIAPAIAPALSSKEDLSLSGSPRASPDVLIPLPEGWQPPESDWRFAVEQLTEFGDHVPRLCLDKFRDHWEADSGPRSRRTERQWRAAFRKWVRSEREYLLRPRLPLMQTFTGGRSNGGRKSKSISDAIDGLILRAEQFEQGGCPDPMAFGPAGGFG